MSAKSNKNDSFVNLYIDGNNGIRFLEQDNFLYDKVEIIKDLIIKDDSDITKSNNENSYGYIFNNIFINGDRGTGKTSVAETVKKEMEKNYKNQIAIVGDIIDVSVSGVKNTDYILTSYFLAWLKIEFKDDEEIMEKIFKLSEKFPGIQQKNENFWDKLDRLDLNFMKELHEVIDTASEKNKWNRIVMFVDDIDLVNVNKIQALLSEIYSFLAHRKLIIVGLGNISNILEKFINNLKKEDNFITEHAQNIANSYFEKSFPTSNIITFDKLTWGVINNLNLMVKQKKEYIKTSFNTFLSEKIDFLENINKNEKVFLLISILDNIPIRQFIVILNTIYLKNSNIDNERKTISNNLRLSRIFIESMGLDNLMSIIPSTIELNNFQYALQEFKTFVNQIINLSKSNLKLNLHEIAEFTSFDDILLK